MSTTLLDKKRALESELPPISEVELDEVPETSNIRLTIGIKNSLPINAPGDRWVSISPFVSVSADVPADGDLLRIAMSLYDRITPAYGYLLIQEHAVALSIVNRNPTAIGLEMVSRGNES